MDTLEDTLAALGECLCHPFLLFLLSLPYCAGLVFRVLASPPNSAIFYSSCVHGSFILALVPFLLCCLESETAGHFMGLALVSTIAGEICHLLAFFDTTETSSISMFSYHDGWHECCASATCTNETLVCTGRAVIPHLSASIYFKVFSFIPTVLPASVVLIGIFVPCSYYWTHVVDEESSDTANNESCGPCYPRRLAVYLKRSVRIVINPLMPLLSLASLSPTLGSDSSVEQNSGTSASDPHKLIVSSVLFAVGASIGDMISDVLFLYGASPRLQHNNNNDTDTSASPQFDAGGLELLYNLLGVFLILPLIMQGLIILTRVLSLEEFKGKQLRRLRILEVVVVLLIFKPVTFATETAVLYCDFLLWLGAKFFKFFGHMHLQKGVSSDRYDKTPLVRRNMMAGILFYLVISPIVIVLLLCLAVLLPLVCLLGAALRLGCALVLLTIVSGLHHLKLPILLPNAANHFDQLLAHVLLGGHKSLDTDARTSFAKAQAFSTAYLVESIFESVPQIVVQVLYARESKVGFEPLGVASLAFSGFVILQHFYHLLNYFCTAEVKYRSLAYMYLQPSDDAPSFSFDHERDEGRSRAAQTMAEMAVV